MVTTDNWLGGNELRAYPYEGNVQRRNPNTGDPVITAPNYPRADSVPPFDPVSNPVLQRGLEVVSAPPPVQVRCFGNITKMFLRMDEHGLRLQDPLNADILQAYLDVEFKLTDCPVRTRNFWNLGDSVNAGIPSNWVETALAEFADHWVSSNPYAFISALLSGAYPDLGAIPPEYGRQVIANWSPSEFASYFAGLGPARYLRFRRTQVNPFVAGTVEYYTSPVESSAGTWTAYCTGAFTMRFKVGSGGILLLAIDEEAPTLRYSSYVPSGDVSDDYFGFGGYQGIEDPQLPDLPPAHPAVSRHQFRLWFLKAMSGAFNDLFGFDHIKYRSVSQVKTVVATWEDVRTFATGTPTTVLYDKIFREDDDNMPFGEVSIRGNVYDRPGGYYTNMISTVGIATIEAHDPATSEAIAQYMLEWFGYNQTEMTTLLETYPSLAWCVPRLPRTEFPSTTERPVPIPDSRQPILTFDQWNAHFPAVA